MKFKQLREKYRSKYPASLVAAAVKIAIDMGGNMTGAYKKIEAMKRGLADDPIVADALKQANESVNEELGEVRPFKKGWSPDEWRTVRKDKKIEKDIEKFYKSMGGKYGDPRKAMTVKQAEKNIPYLYKHVVSNFGNVDNAKLANAISKFYDHWDNGKGVYKHESVNEGKEEYVMKKGTYTRKVDGKTADKMKRQGWKLVAKEEVNEDYNQDLKLATNNIARLAKKEKGQDQKDYQAVSRALAQGNLGAVKKVIKGISTKEIQSDLLNILVGYNDLIAKLYPKAMSGGKFKSGMTVDKMIKEDTVEEGMKLKDIMRKHKRELTKAYKTGDLSFTSSAGRKAEDDLMKWAMDNGEVNTDDPDDFFNWLSRDLEDIVKGRIKEQSLSPSEKKLVNQMYDKKGNLTPLGKKVFNHNKKPGDKGYVENVEEGKVKELQGYIDSGKSAQWISKKMKIDVKHIKSFMDEAVGPEEKAQLALKQAKEIETLKKKHEREKENMKEDTHYLTRAKGREIVSNFLENYRVLAKHGMGTETKKSIKVGTEIDYYRADGAKYMGKVTKMTPTTYIVKDTKNGKNYQFTYHDRIKAKGLLKK